jgi:ribose 5-phosphate isomerase B
MAIVKTWMSTDAFTEEKYTRRRDKVADIDRAHTVAVQ